MEDLQGHRVPVQAPEEALVDGQTMGDPSVCRLPRAFSDLPVGRGRHSGGGIRCATESQPRCYKKFHVAIVDVGGDARPN